MTQSSLLNELASQSLWPEETSEVRFPFPSPRAVREEATSASLALTPISFVCFLKDQLVIRVQSAFYTFTALTELCMACLCICVCISI